MRISPFSVVSLLLRHSEGLFQGLRRLCGPPCSTYSISLGSSLLPVVETLSHVGFDVAFVPLLLLPLALFSLLQLTIQDLFWQSVVRHADDVACPSQLEPSDGCGDAGDVGFPQDTDVCSPPCPADSENLAETSLVVLLQGLQMSAVDGPAVSHIEQSGHDDCLVDTFCVGLDVPVFLRTLCLNLAKAALAHPIYGGGSQHQ